MEALLTNSRSFDFALDILETFVKEIFSGRNENQKFKLCQKLQNLLSFHDPDKKIKHSQDLKVNSSREVNLPDEIWLKIIQFLPTKEVFGSFALSCKRFHDLTQDPKAVKYLQLNKIDNDFKFENAMKVVEKSNGIVELKINKVLGHFADELIILALKSSPQLKSLKSDTGILSSKAIQVIANSEIEVLDLEELGPIGPVGISKLCNIKTLRSLKMLSYDRIIISLEKNDVPIEDIQFFSEPICNECPEILNDFFKKKKDSLKSFGLKLDQYDEEYPLNNLNLCQNLEEIVMFSWHSKNLKILYGLPHLKKIVLHKFETKSEDLASFFNCLSLKKLEEISFQYCLNVKEDFFKELSKIDFPELKFLSIHPTLEDRRENDILCDETLKRLVLKCPNLKMIQFGSHFFMCNLNFKTLFEMFHEANIFILFGEIHSQISFEDWLFNNDKNVYENYQKQKMSRFWRVEK